MPPAVPGKWVTCVEYPLPGTNNTDLMCAHFFYRSIAIWADEDRKMARWALEDVVAYTPGVLTHGGLPECVYLLGGAVVDPDAKKVDPGWRDMEEVTVICTGMFRLGRRRCEGNEWPARVGLLGLAFVRPSARGGCPHGAERVWHAEARTPGVGGAFRQGAGLTNRRCCSRRRRRWFRR